jgi:hypothetical protein
MVASPDWYPVDKSSLEDSREEVSTISEGRNKIPSDNFHMLLLLYYSCMYQIHMAVELNFLLDNSNQSDIINLVPQLDLQFPMDSSIQPNTTEWPPQFHSLDNNSLSNKEDNPPLLAVPLMMSFFLEDIEPELHSLLDNSDQDRTYH